MALTKPDFVSKQQARGPRLTDYGFMHIPKTGGTGVVAFGRKVMDTGHPFPLVFPHGWTADAIITKLPGIRLCFVVRDPLARTISAFESRLRMGRPRYNSPWSVEEAVAFSFFPDAFSLLEALASDDERLKSAAWFGIKNISHLKRNYQFYFKSVDHLDAIASNIGIVSDITEIDRFIARMGELAEVPAEFISLHYERQHVSLKPTDATLDNLSPAAAAAVREFLAPEYVLYEYLKTFKE